MKAQSQYKRLLVLAVGMLLPMMMLLTAGGSLAPYSGKIALGPSALPGNVSTAGNYGAGTRYFPGSNNATNDVVTKLLPQGGRDSSAATSVGTWVAGPEDGIEVLYAIDALSADDVWAAGKDLRQSEEKARIALIHWDGIQWWKVAAIDIDKVGNWYANGSHSLKAFAHDNVWLLGQFNLGNGRSSSVMLHWNGKTLEVNSQHAGTEYMLGLRAIDGVAPDNIWAIGSEILHYDGSKWKRVPGPENLATDNHGNRMPGGIDLHGVAAIAANDVWAVGTSAGRALTIHWDGEQWSRVESPSIGFDGMWNILNSVSAASSDDVWAVGYASAHVSGGGGIPIIRPLILHWDGKFWEQLIVPAPSSTSVPGSYDWSRRLVEVSGSYAWTRHLVEVEAISENEVWVRSIQGLMRWDGRSWTSEPCPDRDWIGYRDSVIQDIAVTKPGEVWAVGRLHYYDKDLGLVLDSSDGMCVTPHP